jgi:hypothetical protein
VRSLGAVEAIAGLPSWICYSVCVSAVIVRTPVRHYVESSTSVYEAGHVPTRAPLERV